MPYFPVVKPNYGLMLDTIPLAIPPGGLRDGHNFRVSRGALNNLNLGWVKFTTNWVLNGPVLLIDNFFPRDLDEQLIFGTATDLYRHEPATDEVFYITPVYATGTASVSGVNVTGTGTAWVANAAPGDEIHFGSATQNRPDAVWHTIVDVTGEGALELAASAGTIAAGPYTLRRKFNASQLFPWDVEVFVNAAPLNQDLWFATNGIDPVVTWNGSDTFAVRHPEFGFSASTLAVYSNMMVYGNLVYGGQTLPTSIVNSDVGQPLAVGDVGTGLAEQFVIHPGTDEILNILPLGDYLVAYSARHLTLIQFAGDPIIFLFRNAIAGIGAASADAIADFGDFHIFIGSDAQYNFDGVSVTETNPQVWRDVLRQVDPLRKGNIYAHFDEERGDLIWSIPLTGDAEAGEINGSPEIAYTEHYLEDLDVNAPVDNPYSRRDFPFTATGFYERATGLTWANASGTWADYNYSWNDQFFALGFPQNLVGDTNGQVYILNEAQEADGVPLPSYVRFGRWPSGDGRTNNLLKRVYPYAQPFPHTMNVDVYAGQFPSGNLTSVGAYEYDLNRPEDGHFVSVFRKGKFFEIGFSTAGDAWQIEGYDVDIAYGGNR